MYGADLDIIFNDYNYYNKSLGLFNNGLMVCMFDGLMVCMLLNNVYPYVELEFL